jgi:flagellar protein FlgJ
MNMMLKSMRDASSSQDNPFENEQTKSFTAMLDQQLSQSLTGKGLGLADVLARQLSKNGGAPVAPVNTSSNGGSNTQAEINAENDFLTEVNQATLNIPNPNAVSSNTNEPASTSADAADFQSRMASHAAEASRATGLPAHFMLGQAALESGWGKHEIKGVDGSTSHNLFGIKATGSWDGKVVEAVTTEYVGGVKQKRIEKFRAYDSYADSFKDFANLMRNNPRYNNVMANLDDASAYANAIQKAGYATDPNYASKLTSVIKKVSAG